MQICVRQAGGLGNQMFQYAAGLFYAQKYHAEMVIAIDPPRRAHSFGSPRPFQLSQFCITVPTRPAGWLEMAMQLRHPRLRQATAGLRRLLNADLIAEPKWFCFFPDLPVRANANKVYMRGWWQAAAYAEGVATRLRSDLVLRQAATGKNYEVLQAIQNCPNAVSIHLRRGDYLQWEQGSYVLSLSYYQAAVRKLLEATANPTFYIFSDDIEFAGKNLPDHIQRVFVEHNGVPTAYEDLRLMSACRHNIIANSSFSWWAAWLNQHSEKIVIAPKFWSCRPGAYFPDLFPPDWTLLENL
jgi:hypothetical protein